jgi:hypothetical protein
MRSSCSVCGESLQDSMERHEGICHDCKTTHPSHGKMTLNVDGLEKIAVWAVAAGVVSKARASQLMGISLADFIYQYDAVLNDMGPLSWAEKERKRLETELKHTQSLLGYAEETVARYTEPSQYDNGVAAQDFLAALASIRCN